jgi:hypothetical protein
VEELLGYFNVVGIAFKEMETNSPLVVDGY